MKEYAQERGYLGCCDGINLCMDCQYHVQTSKYYGKWKPPLEPWYNRICKIHNVIGLLIYLTIIMLIGIVILLLIK